MTDLSDKLKSLGVQIGARNALGAPPKPRRGNSIEQVIDGRIHATPLGEAFVVETMYPPEYRHGQIALPLNVPLQTIAEWANETRIAQCEPSRLVFLDTETTGLAGGTGTFAFLIGLGRFVPSAESTLSKAERLRVGSFRLTQIFMRDPIEEPAALAALTEFLQPLDALVTFNGKSFDAPLLRNRYILNRHEIPFSDVAHIDLLPLARRLWRDRLESRALGSLEQHIMGMKRTEDEVPGWLIPQMYFDYLQSGDARPLKGVLYHNAMDVLAMAALLNHIAQMLNDPLNFVLEHGIDIIAIGKLFQDLGRLDDAAKLYARGLELELSESAFRESVKRFAYLQRKRGDLSSAIELWRSAAGTKQVYAFVELAKHYEHKTRDYAQAIEQTRAALAIVHAPDFPKDMRKQWQHELEHRLKRLESKKMKDKR